MADNFGDSSLPPASDLSINTFDEVESTGPKLPTPAFISDAVTPEVLASEWREWVNSITNETSSSVRVHS
jgi:hypothetical protein